MKGVPEQLCVCEISLNVQWSNNQSENRMWCVSRDPSHNGFTPEGSTEPFPICGSAEAEEGLQRRVVEWREALERKGLKENAKKT